MVFLVKYINMHADDLTKLLCDNMTVSIITIGLLIGVVGCVEVDADNVHVALVFTHDCTLVDDCGKSSVLVVPGVNVL